jgi:hypothetical protein
MAARSGSSCFGEARAGWTKNKTISALPAARVTHCRGQVRRGQDNQGADHRYQRFPRKSLSPANLRSGINTPGIHLGGITDNAAIGKRAFMPISASALTSSMRAALFEQLRCASRVAGPRPLAPPTRRRAPCLRGHLRGGFGGVTKGTEQLRRRFMVSRIASSICRGP